MLENLDYNYFSAYSYWK